MWWVLTSLSYFPSYNALTVNATTNLTDHLFMRWHYYEPTRTPLTKRIRGRDIQCGYKYTWDHPHILRQTQKGNTFLHTWRLTDLIPSETIWFYLYAPGGPYGSQIQGPLCHAKLTAVAIWIPRVYVATEKHGVFYTENFVDDISSPEGVPTWTPLNDGLDLAFYCQGFVGDPFDPGGRQYFLTTHNLYRRTTGNWGSVLSRQAMIRYSGCLDNIRSRFVHNGLAVNTNTNRWIAVIFVGEHDVNGTLTRRLYFCLSVTYGYKWLIFVAEDGTLDLPYPSGLTVGQFKGDSPYPAGRVIYFAARKGWNVYCLRSIDGGFTWETFLIGPAFSRDSYLWDNGYIAVDPNSQDKCYYAGAYAAGIYSYLKRSTDHAETWPDFDDNADQPLGKASPYLSLGQTFSNILRVGTEVNRLSFYKTTDAGATWTQRAPPVESVHLGIFTPPATGNSLYIAATFTDNYTKPHSIWASDDEGTTMIPKSGAHTLEADGGGDSIPWTHGDGIRNILPVTT
ncbi:hypothetical protein ES705_19296 [subsurface metagenome]